MLIQGFHVVLSDMCHSTMGSSSADVLRSLDLASCAAELAVGSLQPDTENHFPQVHNPMPEHSRTSSQQQSLGHQRQKPQSGPQEGSGQMNGGSGLLLPKGHLVMKLLQASQPCSWSRISPGSENAVSRTNLHVLIQLTLEVSYYQYVLVMIACMEQLVKHSNRLLTLLCLQTGCWQPRICSATTSAFYQSSLGSTCSY